MLSSVEEPLDPSRDQCAKIDVTQHVQQVVPEVVRLVQPLEPNHGPKPSEVGAAAQHPRGPRRSRTALSSEVIGIAVLEGMGGGEDVDPSAHLLLLLLLRRRRN
jgi:hypothetical protein